MRMSEARIGFGDQKRMGRSASGQSIGEIDGVIKHSDNTRIAIFEAFRLFSLEKGLLVGIWIRFHLMIMRAKSGIYYSLL